ncbi:hypothetical protein [Phyllobacterium meliloti]|uniref:hypothetical protein n=1 Tax=Phyllobacterium meliloti TaxID=555317 RepID=UPI001D1359B0|nr:hypothetical protein [Phyllobacterium sp. T1293]UGX88206.1 hypothetical protein LLE53_006835 [Phyllobacterium sp. T1293]
MRLFALILPPLALRRWGWAVISTLPETERFRRIASFQEKQGNTKFMDDSVQKSCWGITAWAVIGFAVILLVTYLVVIH